MANITRSPTTGTISFNGRGVTGGPINSGSASMGSGWGIGLAFSGKVPTLYNTTLNKEITTGAPDALIFAGSTPTLAYSWTVVPAKGELQFTGNTATLQNGIPVGSGALAVTGKTPSIAYSWTVKPTTQALQFTGDAPSLAYSWTVKPTTQALQFTGSTPTIAYSWTVKPTTTALQLSASTPSLAYSWTVKPTTTALQLTGSIPSLAYSWNVTPTLGSLQFTGYAPSINVGLIVAPTTGALQFTGYESSLNFVIPLNATALTTTGITPDRINIANSGTSITNASATTTVPSNYEQCDYTGFRQLPGSLKLTWNKHAVRRKSYESRHPQESLRSVPEKPKGSRRPEQPDRFISETVSEDDL